MIRTLLVSTKPLPSMKKHNQESEVPPTKSPAEQPLLSPSNDPLPSGKDSEKLKGLMDLCTNLSNKVLEFESEVIDIKSTYQARIEKLEGKVESMLDVNEEEPADVEEVLEVVKAAKLMTDVVTTAEATKVSVLRKKRGVVIQDPKETTTTANMQPKNAVIKQVKRSERLNDDVMKYQTLNRKPLTQAEARRNMIVYLKNMVGFKMKYFKGMTYNEIRTLFKKHYNFNQVFLDEVNEGVKVPKKEVREEKEVKVERSKREGESLDTMMKNFDREDLESLWKMERIVRNNGLSQVTTARSTLCWYLKLLLMKRKEEDNEDITLVSVQDDADKEMFDVDTLVEWDDIQAKIDVDHQLAERWKAQEQEELSDAEKATLFQQLLEKRRKHFTAKRLKEFNLLKWDLQLETIFERQVNRVHVLDIEGLTLKMRQDLAERLRMVYTRDAGQEIFDRNEMGLDVTDALFFQLGGARCSITWRQFILALGLHTVEEIAEDGLKAYWLGSERVIPDKGDLSDYWIEISSNMDFLGQAPKKVTSTNLFYLRSMDREIANIMYLLAQYLFTYAEGKEERCQ
nr:hypothetical protein [Tanacetum cinerariifolium]